MEIKIESVVPLFNIRGGASFAPRQSEKGKKVGKNTHYEITKVGLSLINTKLIDGQI